MIPLNRWQVKLNLSPRLDFRLASDRDTWCVCRNKIVKRALMRYPEA